MFSGIIKHIGRVKKIYKRKNYCAIEILSNMKFSKKEEYLREKDPKLKKIIDNQSVECQVSDIDIYDRYVAICSTIKTNLNKWMVKNGWAIAYRYYSTDYILEEKYARENKLGIWKSEFLKPYQYRKNNKN